MCNTCNSNYTDKYQRNFAEISQKRQDKKVKTALITAGVATLANALATALPIGLSIFPIAATYCSNNETTGTKPATENDDATSSKKVKQEEETSEEKVVRLIKVDKNSDPKLFADLVKKCNSLRERDPNISDDIIKVSLRNYVNGYNLQNQSLKQQVNIEGVYNHYNGEVKDPNELYNTVTNSLNTDVFNDLKIAYKGDKNNTKDIQNHFNELATNYLAIRDTDSNFGLDFLEMYTSSLAQHYCKTEEDIELSDAIIKAEKYVRNHKEELLAQFEQWKATTTINPAEGLSDEEFLAMNVFYEIQKFGGSDYNMDTKEIAEMLFAKSIYADGDKPDYDISAADTYKFETDLAIAPNLLNPFLEQAREFMKQN